VKATYGKQQGDAWVRNRIGRITGSRIEDVVAILTRKSGDRVAGQAKAERDKYRRELIGERLTGRAKNHYVTPSMEHGNNTEDDARLYYERFMNEMCIPVSFVLHEKYDFAGSSPDSLVGDEGILEIKCPETTTHIEYRDAKVVPVEYRPQIGWELACTGRKWADFVSFDPRIHDPKARFFYQRLGRDELEWKVGDRTYTGESVIDYFTEHVLKLEAEIQYYFAENGFAAVAPYPVEVITEDGEVIEDETGITDEDWAVIERRVQRVEEGVA